ncbi:nitrilotriacetate monooxygenase component B [Colletotrichum scovillei]|uniref:Nitrilotriacetate monooxygenase component B n=1 Tax=Colletotrichum scovillei TaxID=1209932 RepID=A0A9P7R692_9PEZI|nr:nitrilotriacetate monooxygenase component B [Colletotrichum scovillei]KAF4782807.1 nitrilotriacetate monooxygenase component B [Colletotrichum scovillei]KAG7050956.1 nitrilotriacetate monooxygenase component B [Colletotrichum scovillei]KAG7069995.1 nitrilotriacetate monooxygenase component B [Colletotrichum scovillei]KAG7078245.1 nitrilotriacetate monooxygenase component B [Colletotrichum scovillei]
MSSRTALRTLTRPTITTNLIRPPYPQTAATPRTLTMTSQNNSKFSGGTQATHNPHPDFKSVESTRPPFNTEASITFTKTISPDWSFGSGANPLGQPGLSTPHVAIDPHAEGRPAGFNYKLLISAITPRPIAFLSTRSADGTVTNLAPFSYFNMVNHDPPMFVVGFAASIEKPKDSLKCLLESKECVINIISEGFLEAANSTSVNAPYGKSEWDVSGLTPVHDCKHLQAARVKEAVFSVEGKLDFVKEWDSRATPGKKSGVTAFIEGVNFWVREDAINEQKNIVDPTVLRPVSRLGGITYGRTIDVLEIPRADWDSNIGGEEGYEKLKKSKQ